MTRASALPDLQKAYGNNGHAPGTAPDGTAQVAPAPPASNGAAPAASTAAPAEPSFEERIAQARSEGGETARRESQASIAGMQRTMSRMQRENADLRAQAANLSYLPTIAELLRDSAKRTMGPEEARLFDLQQENTTLRQAIEANRPTQPDPAYEPPTATAPRQPSKREVLDYWFPGEQVAPDDPRIDWALDIVDSDPASAQRRFRTSVTKALKEDARAGAQHQVEAAHRQLAEVDRTDGSLPAGAVVPSDRPAYMESKNPKDWRRHRQDMLRSGFDQSSVIRSETGARAVVYEQGKDPHPWQGGQ